MLEQRVVAVGSTRVKAVISAFQPRFRHRKNLQMYFSRHIDSFIDSIFVRNGNKRRVTLGCNLKLTLEPWDMSTMERAPLSKRSRASGLLGTRKSSVEELPSVSDMLTLPSTNVRHVSLRPTIRRARFVLIARARQSSCGPSASSTVQVTTV